MLVTDVNGDGLNDIIIGSDHGYGLAWYEQVKETDKITFRQHLILNPAPKPNSYGITFSQLHALEVIDMDGDGLKDIVTGKRFWAHGPHGGDPESDNPPVLYWFKLVRSAKGEVDFVPHQIDDNSGIGTQVVAKAINGDKLPSIVVGNKKGVFVFEPSQSK